MTQYVHPFSEHRPSQLWRHQERMKCSTAAMPALWDVRGALTPPVLSADSFSREISRGKILSSATEMPHVCPKSVFFKTELPHTILCQAGWEYPWGGFGSRSSNPISPGFSKCPCLLGELLWHLFCLLLKRHWLQFRRVSSEQVQCQIVLKTCPFHLLSGYCTQMNRGLLSLETFWSTKYSRKSTVGTNSLRHQ